MSPGFSLGTKRNQARKRGEKMKEDVGRGEALLGWTKAENKWLLSQLLWNAAKIFVCI